MINFTLDELRDFTQHEGDMVEKVLPFLRQAQEEPDEEIIQNILNYSKSLSVRTSKHLKKIKLMLN
jgi:hypothetical protein